MDAAPTAYVLWLRFLRYDPADPHWLNRDRFVLSSGHASMLLYSLIHLTGIKAANPSYERPDRDAVTLEDIKNFRQAGSRCPGPGIWLDLRGRNHDRAARSRRGDKRRHGDRRSMAARNL
jgi:transketolase